MQLGGIQTRGTGPAPCERELFLQGCAKPCEDPTVANQGCTRDSLKSEWLRLDDWSECNQPDLAPYERKFRGHCRRILQNKEDAAEVFEC